MTETTVSVEELPSVPELLIVRMQFPHLDPQVLFDYWINPDLWQQWWPPDTWTRMRCHGVTARLHPGRTQPTPFPR